ncbi:MAG TPA: DinB family protein [Bryobacteraceae bacterium]|nr:DinB family protein [Bryobacteraceae bacterium]
MKAMNYYGAKDLASSFRTVRKNTITIAEEIGEQHYGFSPAPDVRTVAQTLVHIGLSPRMAQQIHAVERRTKLEGFDFMGFMQKMVAEEKTPRNKAQITAFLREEGEKLASWLDGQSDDFLGEKVTMPPGMQPASKTRFEMLLGLKEHEMHHRGQLMLIERMVGVVPHLTREMQARMAQMNTQAAAKPA